MRAPTHRLVDLGWRRRHRDLRRRVLAWYRESARRLPWRDSGDAYGVLVSELMSQQTQADRVASAWPAFMARFPTVHDLAQASAADVLAAWRGLGYNRRALHLRQASQVVVTAHGGRVPDDVTALEELPGVGAYTARAVAAFAYGRPVGPVDTNVARVLSRAVAGFALARGSAQQLADDLVPPLAPAEWSQALMDLGTAHCVARSPACATCPIVRDCAWSLAGHRTPDPAADGAHAPRGQGRFAGSDRWHRGRIIDALREGPLPQSRLAAVLHPHGDPGRIARIVDALVDDGLVVRREGIGLDLPGSDRPGRDV